MFLNEYKNIIGFRLFIHTNYCREQIPYIFFYSVLAGRRIKYAASRFVAAAAESAGFPGLNCRDGYLC